MNPFEDAANGPFRAAHPLGDFVVGALLQFEIDQLPFFLVECREQLSELIGEFGRFVGRRLGGGQIEPGLFALGGVGRRMFFPLKAPLVAEMKASLFPHLRQRDGTEEAPQALGVGQSYVSKLERGENFVDVLLYARWCIACGVKPGRTLDALLSGTAYKP